MTPESLLRTNQNLFCLHRSDSTSEVEAIEVLRAILRSDSELNRVGLEALLVYGSASGVINEHTQWYTMLRISSQH